MQRHMGDVTARISRSWGNSNHPVYLYCVIMSSILLTPWQCKCYSSACIVANGPWPLTASKVHPVKTMPKWLCAAGPYPLGNSIRRPQPPCRLSSPRTQTQRCWNHTEVPRIVGMKWVTLSKETLERALWRHPHQSWYASSSAFGQEAKSPVSWWQGRCHIRYLRLWPNMEPFVGKSRQIRADIKEESIVEEILGFNTLYKNMNCRFMLVSYLNECIIAIHELKANAWCVI